MRPTPQNSDSGPAVGRARLNRAGIGLVGAFTLVLLLIVVGGAYLLTKHAGRDPLHDLLKRYTRLQRSGLQSELSRLGTQLVETAIAESTERSDTLVFYSLLAVIQDPVFRTEDRVRAAGFLGTHFAGDPYLASVILSMGTSGDLAMRPVLETFATSSRPPVRVYAAYALALLLANPFSPSARTSRDVLAAVRLFQQVRQFGAHYRHPVYVDYTLAELADGQIRKLTQLRTGDEAPEIEGVDLSGADLKLSDFRGNVVLLYFWGGW